MKTIGFNIALEELPLARRLGRKESRSESRAPIVRLCRDHQDWPAFAGGMVSGDLTIAMFPDQVRAPDLEVFFSVPEDGDQCGSIFAAIINRWTGPIVEPRFDGPFWDCDSGLDVALAGEIL